MRGGRHTVVAICDAGEVVDESDETDNVYTRDVEVFVPASVTFRNAGPNPTSYTVLEPPILGQEFVASAATPWEARTPSPLTAAPLRSSR